MGNSGELRKLLPSMFSLIARVWSASFGILQKLVNYGAPYGRPNPVAELGGVLKTDYTGGSVRACDQGLMCPGQQKFWQEKFGGNAGTDIATQAEGTNYKGW